MWKPHLVRWTCLALSTVSSIYWSVKTWCLHYGRKLQSRQQPALSSERFAGSKSQGVGRWAPATTRFIAYVAISLFPFLHSALFHTSYPCASKILATPWNRIRYSPSTIIFTLRRDLNLLMSNSLEAGSEKTSESLATHNSYVHYTNIDLVLLIDRF